MRRLHRQLSSERQVFTDDVFVVSNEAELFSPGRDEADARAFEHVPTFVNDTDPSDGPGLVASNRALPSGRAVTIPTGNAIVATGSSNDPVPRHEDCIVPCTNLVTLSTAVGPENADMELIVRWEEDIAS